MATEPAWRVCSVVLNYEVEISMRGNAERKNGSPSAICDREIADRDDVHPDQKVHALEPHFGYADVWNLNSIQQNNVDEVDLS